MPEYDELFTTIENHQLTIDQLSVRQFIDLCTDVRLTRPTILSPSCPSHDMSCFHALTVLANHVNYRCHVPSLSPRSRAAPVQFSKLGKVMRHIAQLDQGKFAIPNNDGFNIRR